MRNGELCRRLPTLHCAIRHLSPTQLKHLILTSILAGSLAAPAIAAETPVREPFSPHIKLALDYLQHELEARLNPAAKQPLRLDQPSSAALDDTQKEALRQVFGTEQALDIQRLPGKGPAVNYSLRIPGHQIDRNGERLEWQDLKAQVSIDAAGKRYSANGNWPGLKLLASDGTILIDKVSISAQESRDASGMWMGKSRADAEHISLHKGAEPLDVQFEHPSIQTFSKRLGKKMEQTIDMSAQRMLVAGTPIDQLHIGYRARGLDIDTLLAFRDAARKLNKAEMKEKDLADASVGQALNLFKDLALKGGSLELSDFSGSFEGARFQLKGSVSLPAAKASDLATPEQVLNKLEARMDIVLPQPSLHAMAAAFARLASNKGETVREQDVYDVMLGKLLGPGYARLENGKLVAHLEIKHGMLRITDSKELIPMQSLLKLLKDQDRRPLPDDHSTPVAVTWRSRSLESVRLFAGNGNENAIDELCYRYTKGDQAPQNDEEAGQWCARSKNQPDLSDADHGSDDPSIYNFSDKPGFYSARLVRFDESKARQLELSLSNPGKDPKWAPMMSVCLTAEAPSEQACIKFSQESLDDPRLTARVTLIDTENKSEKTGDALRGLQPQDGTVRLRVFVRDQKAHFIIGDKDELAQDVVFPAELLRLTCSTADCRFKLL